MQIYAAANQSGSTNEGNIDFLVVALESSFPILSEGETCRFLDIPDGAGRFGDVRVPQDQFGSIVQPTMPVFHNVRGNRNSDSGFA